MDPFPHASTSWDSVSESEVYSPPSRLSAEANPDSSYPKATAMSFTRWTSRLSSHRLVDIATTLFTWLQFMCVGAAAIVLGVWAIAPVRERFMAYGLFDEESLLPLFELLIILTLLTLASIHVSLRRVAAHVDQLLAPQSTMIVGGAMHVYKPLLDAVRNTPPKQRTLDVLCLTGNHAWPQISSWVSQAETSRWTIRLFCLSPTFIAEDKRVPSAWVDHAKSTFSGVQEFVNRHSQDLQRRRVAISVHLYDSFPGVHGFSVGNGCLFVSCVHWHSNDKLADPLQQYEGFSAADRSGRADAYRMLFQNWLAHTERAVTTSWPEVAKRSEPVQGAVP